VQETVKLTYLDYKSRLHDLTRKNMMLLEKLKNSETERNLEVSRNVVRNKTVTIHCLKMKSCWA